MPELRLENSCVPVAVWEADTLEDISQVAFNSIPETSFDTLTCSTSKSCDLVVDTPQPEAMIQFAGLVDDVAVAVDVSPEQSHEPKNTNIEVEPELDQELIDSLTQPQPLSPLQPPPPQPQPCVRENFPRISVTGSLDQFLKFRGRSHLITDNTKQQNHLWVELTHFHSPPPPPGKRVRKKT
eukprot:c8902_g1_i2.p1 GENE.c8902_g1_i2~~c8902_g1_i2.p1  ORF type:complete len:182 (-),score=38.84 c8902_g1_i2:792-1337(-)